MRYALIRTQIFDSVCVDSVTTIGTYESLEEAKLAKSKQPSHPPKRYKVSFQYEIKEIEKENPNE